MNTGHKINSLAITAIVGVAAALRLWALGDLPPGLYRDEAFNGLDALGILRGDLSLYFAANNGREPLFMYLLAASVGAVGRTPLALRLPAAFASLLTIPALYLMARAIWNRRIGLISAGTLAVMLWPVHLAHVSFRAGLLPLFLALAVWQAARGWQSGRKKHWLAAGALYGLSFYTYLAARFTPLILALFALYAWLVFLRQDVQLGQRALKGAFFFIIAASLTALPLLLYTFYHWDIVMGRVGQASVFNPAINQGDLAGTLAGNTLKALGMFFVRGDRIYRHNVPWRPVFDPVLGACFAAGVILAARQFKRNAGASLAILWTLVMLLPTILAEDTPHFLRAVGVLPVIAVFPALALEAMQKLATSFPSLWGRGFSQTQRVVTDSFAQNLRQSVSSVFSRVQLGDLAIVSVLLIGLSSTIYAYFVRYPQDPQTAYWFDAAGRALADETLDALDAGARVILDRRLWESWVNLRFMVAPDRIRLIEPEQEPRPVSDKSTLWLVWPYDDWARIWPALPQNVRIEARQGALYQGDKDPEPGVAYLSFRTTPYEAATRPLAQFEQFFQLLEASASSVDGRVRVRLVWRAQAAAVQPFTVFAHLLQNGQRVAQGDGPPANGYYPDAAWRPGDVIVDERWIDWSDLQGNEQVMIGLYNPITGQRLNVLDASGQPVADSIIVAVESGK